MNHNVISERILLMPPVYQKIHRVRYNFYRLLGISLGTFFVDQLRMYKEIYIISHINDIFNSNRLSLDIGSLDHLKNDYELLSIHISLSDGTCYINTDNDDIHEIAGFNLLLLLYSGIPFTKKQFDIVSKLNAENLCLFLDDWI